MGKNGDMTDNAEAGRAGHFAVIAVWLLAAIVALATGFGFEQSARGPWLVLGFALVIVVTFVVQLWHGKAEGFILRFAASSAGAVAIMGLISLAFWLVALI
jgi:hypothetical protein